MIGAGQIAHFTANEFTRHPQADIVAIADPSTARARELAARCGVSRTLKDAEVLIARKNVDAVYIAVPNRFHAEYALAALQAGKHVLLEKPFAMNLAEAEAVARAATKSGKVFMVGMNQRFTREVQTARDIVARGDLGEVFHAKAFWRRRSGIPRIGSWFTHKETSGGGGLLDIGVHMLDAALFLLDNFEPRGVFGATYTKFGNRGVGDGRWGRSERTDERFDVDDFATALVKLKGGVSVALESSWALHQPTADEMSVVLYGTEGTLDAYKGELYRQGNSGYEIVQVPASTELAFAHCSRAHHFVNAILGEEEPLVTLEQSLAVQRILDGIYRSSKSGGGTKL